MDPKRILVVDDDPDMCFLVAHAINSMNLDYRVDTATGAGEALKKTAQTHFDLLVTDYMMPGKTGLDLISAVSELSPATRYVIMTAHHDTGAVRSIAGKMKIGFISKPFMLPEIIAVVQEALTSAPAAGNGAVSSSVPNVVAQPQLNGLLHQTGALSAVLFGRDGTPVLVEGNIQPGSIAKIGTFVANNFRVANETALLFGEDPASFTSSYFEGRTMNIYALDIEHRYFLTVIFNPMTKPGTVWFYAKQTALELAAHLAVSDQAEADGNNNISDISQKFDSLLGGNKNKDNLL